MEASQGRRLWKQEEKEEEDKEEEEPHDDPRMIHETRHESPGARSPGVAPSGRKSQIHIQSCYNNTRPQGKKRSCSSVGYPNTKELSSE